MNEALTLAVDAVDSPDDGGWYLLDHRAGKVSTQVWLSLAAARRALIEDAVTWE